MTENLRTLLAARPDAYHPQTWIADAEERLAGTRRHLTRRGLVVGVSGGVDSAAVAALAALCVPPGRLRLLHLPDKDTDARSTTLAATVAASVGADLEVRDITAALDGFGVYHELTGRIAGLLGCTPADLGPWKLVRTPPTASLTVRWRIHAAVGDASNVDSAPLDPASLAFIVARMNYKQRARTAALYSAADEHGYLVVGTANRVELHTGFFVKNGDGAADAFPIADLYKGEVRQLAVELAVPAAVAARTATTDTFSGPQTQAEFFFGLDEQRFDLVLFGFERRLPVADIAAAADIAADIAAGVYADLVRRQPFLRYLRAHPQREETS